MDNLIVYLMVTALVLLLCEAVSRMWSTYINHRRWLKLCREFNLDPKTGRLIGD